MSILHFLLLVPFLLPIICAALSAQPPSSLASSAVASLNVQANDQRHWKFDRLLSSTLVPLIRQGGILDDDDSVLDGPLLVLARELKLVVVRTECLKQGDRTRVLLDLCPVAEDAPKKVCTFQVFARDGTADEKEKEEAEDIVLKECRSLTEEEKSQNQNERRHSAAEVGREGGGEGEEESSTNGRPANGQTVEMLRRIGRTLKARELHSWAQFEAFARRFSRIYSTKREALKRFHIYKKNLVLAKKLEAKEHGTAKYGETKFMDLTMSEFQKIYLPYQWPLEQRARMADPEEEGPLPTEWDWRAKGKVTGVKDQGQCGSCWAFSVTGNIEGQWALKTGQLKALSEQELLDCDVLDMACSGGLPLQAYREIVRIGGLEEEGVYPYEAHKESCQLRQDRIVAYINDSVQLPRDERQMALWLVRNGPISIGINAMPLQFYRHGIFHPWRMVCSPKMLNHGVLIVGFGQQGNKPFWIIKNSWGTHWGEQGFFRLYRGKNVCGVAEMATSGVIKQKESD